MSDSHHFKFTQKAVEHVTPPESGRVTHWDSMLPGFGIRVSAARPSGHVCKTWVAMYRVFGTRKQVFETIGKMTRITKVEDARERARTSMLAADAGVNPVEKKRGAKEKTPEKDADATPKKDPSRLLPAVIDRYVPVYRASPQKNGKPRREKTVENVEGILNPMKTWQPYKIVNGVKVDDAENWSGRYIDDLSFDDVKSYLTAKGDGGFKVQANRALTNLKPFFKWCVAEKLITVNPIAELGKLYPEVSRERWLSDPEIRAFWWCCEEIGYPYGPMYQFALLNAARRSEVAKLPAKGELDTKKRVWTLPAARTKTSQTHLVYLTDLAMDIITHLPPMIAGSKFVFAGERGGVATGFSKSKRRLDKLMQDYLKQEGHLADDENLQPWTLHDLRRTARTGFSQLTVPLDVKKKLLNHKLGGMDGIYDQWDYFEEKKKALKRWSALIKAIISAK